MKKGRIPREERGCVKPRSWTIAAHLDLGFRQVSYLGQVLTGTDVGIGPSCKDPFQLQQLPNTESGPLSPMGTQPTGTAYGPGWESNQDFLARASAQLQSLPQPPQPLLVTYTPHPSPSLLATLPHPTHPFPTRSPGDASASTGLAMELAQGEESEGPARAIAHSRLRP